MYIFVDEAGDLSDSAATGSKFFLMAAVVANDHESCNRLVDLRLDLERESYELPRGFHAKNDPLPRRQRVFQCLKELHFDMHVVIVRKAEIYELLRGSEIWLYGYALKKMMTSLAYSLSSDQTRKRVVLPIYSTGVLRRQTAAIGKSIVLEHISNGFEVAVWESSSHTGLQIADYCSWAVQRKLERGDDAALSVIKNKIKSVFSPWGGVIEL